MKFYLESINPDQFSEIFQYVPVEGVILAPEALEAVQADPAKVIASMKEVMPDTSVMIVPTITNGFRRILAEARDIHKLAENVRPALPLEPQGYMALKACQSPAVKIQAAGWDALYPEQVHFALANGAYRIVLNWRHIAALTDPETVLKDLEPWMDKILVTGFDNPAQARKAMHLGVQNIGLGYDLFLALLQNPATASYEEALRESWLMSYTRDTLLE